MTRTHLRLIGVILVLAGLSMTALGLAGRITAAPKLSYSSSSTPEQSAAVYESHYQAYPLGRLFSSSETRLGVEQARTDLLAANDETRSRRANDLYGAVWDYTRYAPFGAILLLIAGLFLAAGGGVAAIPKELELGVVSNGGIATLLCFIAVVPSGLLMLLSMPIGYGALVFSLLGMAALFTVSVSLPEDPHPFVLSAESKIRHLPSDAQRAHLRGQALVAAGCLVGGAALTAATFALGFPVGVVFTGLMAYGVLKLGVTMALRVRLVTAHARWD